MFWSGDDEHARTAIGRIETGLATLARRWETTAPADIVERLDGLTRHAPAAPGRMGATLLREWQRTHSRLLLMSAVAQSDNDMPARAAASARTALALARQAGDAPTQAHAMVVLAELTAYTFGNPPEGLLLAAAARTVAPRSHTAVLALATEAHIRASRGEPADRVRLTLQQADEVSQRLIPGRPGYALDALCPAFLPMVGGSALVGAGALDEGRRWLDEAAVLFEEGRAPGALAAVRLYQASAAMYKGELDEAQTLATRALATSAVRPSAWLTGGIALLAARARRRGADWSGLAIQAREWAPGCA